MSASVFPTVALVLQTAFNAEDGLSEEQAIRLYLRMAARDALRDKLDAELRAAFSPHQSCWQALLCNDDYEVLDFECEADARAYAHRILWVPLFGSPGNNL